MTSTIGTGKEKGFFPLHCVKKIDNQFFISVYYPTTKIQMATFTLLVSIGNAYWQRVETPATNERALVDFLMDSWSKDQCHLNFLEIFLNEYNPDGLSRIFTEDSVKDKTESSVDEEEAEEEAEESENAEEEAEDEDEDENINDLDTEENEEVDDDEVDDEAEDNDELDDDEELMDVSTQSPSTSSSKKSQKEHYDDTGDVIMRPAKIYDLSEKQRVKFIQEIREACQPVRARRRFFQLCRENFPRIVFVKPDGFV